MVLLNDPYFNDESYLRTLKRTWGFDADWADLSYDDIFKLTLSGCSATLQLEPVHTNIASISIEK